VKYFQNKTEQTFFLKANQKIRCRHGTATSN